MAKIRKNIDEVVCVVMNWTCEFLYNIFLLWHPISFGMSPDSNQAASFSHWVTRQDMAWNKKHFIFIFYSYCFALCRSAVSYHDQKACHCLTVNIFLWVHDAMMLGFVVIPSWREVTRHKTTRRQVYRCQPTARRRQSLIKDWLLSWSTWQQVFLLLTRTFVGDFHNGNKKRKNIKWEQK